MPYIKKLVMKGFKSFVRKTELPFDPEINVILGPNGSGKSNVSDALCFVLGRLSIKSMRAARAGNLIFLGSKEASPAKEAFVEIIFDNSDNTFSLEKKEISIARLVRKNGQSIYKINNETKTRQDVLSLLAQAGIDPNGFNIILQGEIQNFVRMHTEERRKVIEEVSGISVYEMRKERSLRELDKTEERLKEIIAILRERTTYLNNLEKERQEALRFKKLEEDIKKHKASIIYCDLIKKRKESERVIQEIEKKNKEIEKIKKTILNIQTEIANLESKIDLINSTIQKSTGFEQEKLNQEIADLRAELAGLYVRVENYEKRLSEDKRKKREIEEKIQTEDISLKDLTNESPTIAKKEKELQSKKKEIENLEEQRKKFYTLKSELKSVKEIIHDKNNLLQGYTNESNFLVKQIESLSSDLFDKKTTSEKLNSLKSEFKEKGEFLEHLNKKEVELEKTINVSEHEIKTLHKIKEDISKMDVCPLCKHQITKEHIQRINEETNPKIKELSERIHESKKEFEEAFKKHNDLKERLRQISLEISKRESDQIKISSVEEKKEQIKALQEKIDKTKEGIKGLDKRRKFLEENFDENSHIEQKYETLRIELQEISLRSEETVNSEISFKQREIEREKISLKQMLREEKDLNEELTSLKKEIEEKEESLEEKNEQEEELSKKFQRMIQERDSHQKKIRENETEILNKQNTVHNLEQETNNFKIEKARVDAETENFEIDLLSFPNVEIIKTNREALTEKLSRIQEIFSKIGSVNLRSIEVYDDIKKEYETVKEKVEIIEKEKQGILKIIHEIDIKKKKTFLKTLDELNNAFSENFSQLSVKGQVSLELENKKEPFEGGVNIIVKTGHGKYFDVTSLSGGEQTIVALSLIFAIQELKPYCFYILDEIDAALDKRNSERLAGLLKKYMKRGQYIVITHNDEIITNATNLYGVSMHEGISKIISLKL
jgi:chromosome segregation protein